MALSLADSNWGFGLDFLAKMMLEDSGLGLGLVSRFGLNSGLVSGFGLGFGLGSGFELGFGLDFLATF